MADHPFYCSSDQGVSCSQVATNLQAGLRSLISALHGHVPPRLGRWAILVRLAVAATCFTGGSVCAWLFARCLLDPGACPCFTQVLPSLPVLDLALLPVFAALILTPAKTTPRRHRVLAARVTTGEPEAPGPILLIQTAWTRDVPESGAHDEDACRASEVLLALPPLKDRIYATGDGVFVPLVKPGDRPTPRLPVPPELCQRPSARSSSQGAREPRPLVSPRTQHRPA